MTRFIDSIYIFNVASGFLDSAYQVFPTRVAKKSERRFCRSSILSDRLSLCPRHKRLIQPTGFPVIPTALNVIIPSSYGVGPFFFRLNPTNLFHAQLSWVIVSGLDDLTQEYLTLTDTSAVGVLHPRAETSLKCNSAGC